MASRTLTHLPAELIYQILESCDVRTLTSLSSTTRTIRSLYKSQELQLLAKSLRISLFPIFEIAVEMELHKNDYGENRCMYRMQWDTLERIEAGLDAYEKFKKKDDHYGIFCSGDYMDLDWHLSFLDGHDEDPPNYVLTVETLKGVYKSHSIMMAYMEFLEKKEEFKTTLEEFERSWKDACLEERVDGDVSGSLPQSLHSSATTTPESSTTATTIPQPSTPLSPHQIDEILLISLYLAVDSPLLVKIKDSCYLKVRDPMAPEGPALVFLGEIFSHSPVYATMRAHVCVRNLITHINGDIRPSVWSDAYTEIYHNVINSKVLMEYMAEFGCYDYVRQQYSVSYRDAREESITTVLMEKLRGGWRLGVGLRLGEEWIVREAVEGMVRDEEVLKRWWDKW